MTQYCRCPAWRTSIMSREAGHNAVLHAGHRQYWHCWLGAASKLRPWLRPQLRPCWGQKGHNLVRSLLFLNYVYNRRNHRYVHRISRFIELSLPGNLNQGLGVPCSLLWGLEYLWTLLAANQHLRLRLWKSPKRSPCRLCSIWTAKKIVAGT